MESRAAAMAMESRPLLELQQYGMELPRSSISSHPCDVCLGYL